MYKIIHDNLHRQFKGLELLQSLLDEEYALLCDRNIDEVTSLEFSIHELLRQIAVERVELKEILQGTKLLEYAGMLPEDEDAAAIRKLYALIDSLEQSSCRQASQNAQLSLALMDQSQSLLAFLHDHMAPRQTTTYGARGRIRTERPDASLISGRL